MSVDWKNIQVTAKELIGVIFFVLSMSGLYYKTYYDGDYEKRTYEQYMRITDARLDKIEADRKVQNEIFKIQIDQLMDDLKSRRAVDEYKKSTEFVPLNKSK